jgi:hypothetical protein
MIIIVEFFLQGVYWPSLGDEVETSFRLTFAYFIDFDWAVDYGVDFLLNCWLWFGPSTELLTMVWTFDWTVDYGLDFRLNSQLSFSFSGELWLSFGLSTELLTMVWTFEWTVDYGLEFRLNCWLWFGLSTELPTFIFIFGWTVNNSWKSKFGSTVDIRRLLSIVD